MNFEVIVLDDFVGRAEIAVGDFDNDGWNDVAFVCRDANELREVSEKSLKLYSLTYLIYLLDRFIFCSST